MKDEFLKTIRKDLEHGQKVLNQYSEIQRKALLEMSLTEWTSAQGQNAQRKDDYLFCAETLLLDAIRFLKRAENIKTVKIPEG